MIGSCLLGISLPHTLKAKRGIAAEYLTQSTGKNTSVHAEAGLTVTSHVEEDFGRVKAKLEAQLLVVTLGRTLTTRENGLGTTSPHVCIAVEVEVRLLKVIQRLLVSLQEKVANPSLKLSMMQVQSSGNDSWVDRSYARAKYGSRWIALSKQAI